MRFYDMKIKDLKELLEDTLNALEDYDDDETLVLHSNTYSIDRKGHIYIGTRDGFIDIENIQVEGYDDDEI